MTERSDAMPVIGRLDDQVEAVLINPVKRRQTHVEEEREQPAAPASAAEERDEAEATAEQRESESALPVWLL
jgi:microcompartment protein CcmL/EutN